MANIKINSTPTRVQYTATAGQTVYTFNFPIKEQTDLKVYSRGASDTPDNDDDVLTLTTDYTVVGANTEDGGEVTLVAASTLGDIVTIVGDKDVDRTAIYNNSSTLKKADLNNDFNDNVMYDKQIETIQEQLTPKYNRSELIGPSVRQDNLKLPILNDGYIWIGRGDFGDSPDDINTVAIGDFDALGLLSVDYVIGTAEPNLPNAQVLGGLGTGFLYSTDDGTTGTVSIRDPDEIGTEVLTVTQAAHGFSVGNWLYRDATSVYALAQADDATTAEAIGVVIEVVDVDTFKLQQSGYLSQAGVFAGLTDGDLYYLSASVAGGMTTTEPTAADEYSKPLFIVTSATNGWILSYRTRDNFQSNTSKLLVNQAAHGLAVEDVVRLNGTNYIKAVADSAANAETVGIVVEVVDVDNFVVQQSGYVDGLFAGLVAGTVYFLDPVTPGLLTTTEPTTTGQVSNPMFIASDTDSGWILPYRGMIVGTGGGGGGGGGWELVSTVDASNDATINFEDLDGTYMFVFSNVTPSAGNKTFTCRVGTGAAPTYQTGSYTGGFDSTGLTTSVTLSQPVYYLGGVASSGDGTLYLHECGSSTQYKTVQGTTAYTDIAGVGQSSGNVICGQWKNTTAVTAFQFLFVSANISTGKFSCYKLTT